MRYDVSKFKRALFVKGWSQKTLARKARLSQSTVCDFLNGDNNSPETAKKLAVPLGIDLEHVVIMDELPPAADLPTPRTGTAQKELLESARSKRA